MQTVNVLEHEKNILYSADSLPKPKASFSDELLTAFHPLIRLPLPDWGKLILDQLQAVSTTESDYQAISVCSNQAALIEFHFGRAENAFALCHAHLEWLARLITGTGKPELAVQAFDPWLNLGRLERLLGKNEVALQRFEQLNALPQNEARLGPITFTPAHWQAIREFRPDMEDFLDYACTVELLKTWLKGKQYEMVVRFSDEKLNSSPEKNLENILLEAKFTALCRLGHKDKAFEQIRPYVQPRSKETEASGRNNALRRLIFRLRMTEALAFFEDYAAAEKLALEIAILVEIIGYGKEPKFLKTALNLRLVKLLQLLGQTEAAYRIAKPGYEAVTLLRDEPLRLEYLTTLAALSANSVIGQSEQAYWQNLQQKAACSTCYKGIRAKLLATFPLANCSERNELDRQCATVLDVLFTRLSTGFQRN